MRFCKRVGELFNKEGVVTYSMHEYFNYKKRRHMILPNQSAGIRRNVTTKRKSESGVFAQLFKLPRFSVARTFAVLDNDPCIQRAADRYIDCQVKCQTKHEDGTLDQRNCLDNCDVGYDIDVRLCRL